MKKSRAIALSILTLMIVLTVYSHLTTTANSQLTTTAEVNEIDGIGPLAAVTCGTPGFSPPTRVSLGSITDSVAIGDFNNDGKLDLAVARASANAVSIRLGDGLGGFTSPTIPEIAVGTNPRSVALGDFNNDGNLDFATANDSSFNVSIRLGDGMGGFTSPTTPEVPAGQQPFSVALGDFNNDGNLDFATANFASGNVSIRLGDGLGGFTAPNTPEIAVGTTPRSVALGDFNNDGQLDFAAANQGNNNVSIRLGDGLGGFTAPTIPQIAVGNQPFSIALGDFNNDGQLDFVTANFNATNVSIRLGDGLGGFTSPPTPAIGVGNRPISVTLGDFNNDGQLDFATANSGSSNVSIRLGNGLGGFTSPPTPQVSLGTVPVSIAPGDFNNDGQLDFATANASSSTVSIALNNFTSTCAQLQFGPAANQTVASTPRSVALGDFNNDGQLDFATANSGSNNVSIRLGDGMGGFTSPPIPEIAVGTTPLSVALGDFNNDGQLDFAAANGSSAANSVSIRLGDGQGGFTSPTIPQIPVGVSPQSVALGDFNNDGQLDFATANFGPDNVSIRLGDGLGGFTSPTTPEIAVGDSPQSVALGDFNNDGQLDFAAANAGPDNVSIRLGDGQGGFTSPTTPEIAVVANPRLVALGDFNNDGQLDFATANTSTNTVSIRLGDGLGGFTAPTTPEIAVGATPLSVALGDFNNDGKLDFAAANLGPDNVSIRLGDGLGGFTAPTTPEIAVAINPQPVALGDFNNDSKLDFATANGVNNVSIVLNTCLGAPNAITPTTGAGQSTLINTAFASQFQATVRDPAGTPLSGVTVSFDSPPSGASGLFANGQTTAMATTDANGIATAPVFTANGTPGSYNVTASASNGMLLVCNTFSLTNTCPIITVSATPTTPPTGVIGVAYAGVTFNAVGGSAPYTFSLMTAGTLPPGLSLSSSGAVTGTPTSAGTFSFTIVATAAGGCTGTLATSITISACQTITLSPSTLSNQTSGVGFSTTLSASGGSGPYTFAVTAGALPNGVALSSAGVLSGTTSAGTYNFTVTAMDANQCTGSRSYTLTVVCGTYQLGPNSLPQGVRGALYNTQLTASVPAVAPVSYQVIGGTIPAGISLSSSGLLRGFPVNGGVFNFTVRATDVGGCTSTRTFTLQICSAQIVLNPLPTTGQVNLKYFAQVSPSGGTGPYEITLIAGALPPGVTLNTANILTGQLTATGTYTFTLQAKDSAGCIGTRTYTITVTR